MEVTELLVRWSEGDQAALDALMPVVYDELRRMANRYVRREPAGHTLQATALVHEAYLRLVDQKRVRWQSRAHFFGLAAQLMRRILVDHARGRQAVKRGGSSDKLTLGEIRDWAGERELDVIALDSALTSLATLDLQKSRIVELRFFGGLSVDEVAEHLQTSPRSIARQWRLAKAWLYAEIGGGSAA